MARGEAVAVGHRGDPYKYRENTLPSLLSALRAGAGAVETDARLTRDGVPVLLHDRTLKRLWDHDRPLAAVTADELRGLTDGGVPTLSEALAEAAAFPAARLLIDFPDPAAVPAVVAEVRARGAADRVYYCGGGTAMLAVRAADPDAEIALSWDRAAPPRPALLARVRPQWLNYRFGLITEDLVRRTHDEGMLMAAWTPDTRRTMTRLLRMGVDSITTNRIDTLRRLHAG
ncbi:glycerophosphodiester phosphodiesterase [Streptomyces sp. H27-D2]|uniref:glycerophosphodiester phosphodiesterase n=1 Tax=Streptomyces sp. H27-D2 TaxID=3046304 RepID=UPI002DC027D0|nr:glycerophosphodiester phosphodiesterase family protein [Streptomyces sp. H27-D2]MEC4020139.1 glycerophosphodiester phosphodiesterase family protein [Streptomyces sp. H27-D2]